MGKTKNLSAFEWGIVVGARKFKCVKNCNAAGFITQLFPVCIRHPANFTKTVGSIGVVMGQRPCGMLSTPFGVHAPTNLRLFSGQKGVQLNIRKCS